MAKGKQNYQSKLEHHQALINMMAHCKDKLRRAIIKNSDQELIEIIVNCVFNLLQGNIPLNNSDKNKLIKYKQILRKLVANSSFHHKKKLLLQQGGFLPILLGALGSGLASAIGGFFGKKLAEV